MATPVNPHHQEFLDEHFGVAPRWTELRKKLRSQSFREAVQQDSRADPKLRRFAKVVGLRQGSKQKGIQVPSYSSRRKYRVRYHPEARRFSCTCPDWTYKRSTQTRTSVRDCKHIQSMRDDLKRTLREGSEKTAQRRASLIGRAAREAKKNLLYG